MAPSSEASFVVEDEESPAWCPSSQKGSGGIGTSWAGERIIKGVGSSMKGGIDSPIAGSPDERLLSYKKKRIQVNGKRLSEQRKENS